MFTVFLCDTGFKGRQYSLAKMDILISRGVLIEAGWTEIQRDAPSVRGFQPSLLRSDEHAIQQTGLGMNRFLEKSRPSIMDFMSSLVG